MRADLLRRRRVQRSPAVPGRLQPQPGGIGPEENIRQGDEGRAEVEGQQDRERAAE